MSGFKLLAPNRKTDKNSAAIYRESPFKVSHSYTNVWAGVGEGEKKCGRGYQPCQVSTAAFATVTAGKGIKGRAAELFAVFHLF